MIFKRTCFGRFWLTLFVLCVLEENGKMMLRVAPVAGNKRNDDEGEYITTTVGLFPVCFPWLMFYLYESKITKSELLQVLGARK